MTVNRGQQLLEITSLLGHIYSPYSFTLPSKSMVYIAFHKIYIHIYERLPLTLDELRPKMYEYLNTRKRKYNY